MPGVVERARSARPGPSGEDSPSRQAPGFSRGAQAGAGEGCGPGRGRTRPLGDAPARGAGGPGARRRGRWARAGGVRGLRGEGGTARKSGLPFTPSRPAGPRPPCLRSSGVNSRSASVVLQSAKLAPRVPTGLPSGGSQRVSSRRSHRPRRSPGQTHNCGKSPAGTVSSFLPKFWALGSGPGPARRGGHSDQLWGGGGAGTRGAAAGGEGGRRQPRTTGGHSRGARGHVPAPPLVPPAALRALARAEGPAARRRPSRDANPGAGEETARSVFSLLVLLCFVSRADSTCR